MRKLFVCAMSLAAAAATFAGTADAEVGLYARIRAVHIDTANKSDAVPALAVPGDAITVSNKTIPEFDFTYFFTKNVAAELVLTYPQKHTVTIERSALGGPVGIGSFKHLPPTLTVQYHFAPDGTFRPYVGAGINYTRIMDVKLAVPTVGSLSLDKQSIGWAVGAGFDYQLDKNLFLNVDVKKVQIESDVKLGGSRISTVKLDPVLFGVGVGFWF